MHNGYPLAAFRHWLAFTRREEVNFDADLGPIIRFSNLRVFRVEKNLDGFVFGVRVDLDSFVSSTGDGLNWVVFDFGESLKGFGSTTGYGHDGFISKIEKGLHIFFFFVSRVSEDIDGFL